MDLITEIENLDFSIKSREHFSSEILNNPYQLEEVINFLEKSEFEYSEKILAGLEFTSRKNSSILFPFSDLLIGLAGDYSGPSGKRALSKILVNYVKDPKFQLKPQQKEKIITICFNWLISEEKVAVKVFCIEILYVLSVEHTWTNDNLKAILNKDYNSQSAGYKARARKILKKLE